MIITIARAIDLLSNGDVVAVPTETVYGLAADALNPSVIAKVFAIKNRPADNPLICHFHSIEQVKSFVNEIPPLAEILMKKMCPGPISFMLDLPENSPLSFATCGSAQVIARIPDHKIFLEIIRGLNRPVAAPSANTSGKVSPTSATMVENDLGMKLSGIVDGGTSHVGLESTIVDARSENEIFILRPGFIGEKEIHEIVPSAKIVSQKIPSTSTTPGTKYSHYAPSTPVFMFNQFDELKSEQNTIVLLTEEQFLNLPEELKRKFAAQKIELILLGSMKNLNELARTFYQRIASIDHARVSKSWLMKNDWGNSSLGKALQNRIEKIVSAK